MDTPYVFVSYSRRQYYVAEQAAASLSANGVPAWLDVQEIPPGTEWQAAIDQGIARCRALVVVASRSAYRSAAVRHEIATAQAAGKPVYLAVIQNCPFVQQLKGKVSVVDCRFEFESHIAALAHAIQVGEALHETIRGWPLGSSIPFGRGKYHQLLLVALSYTIGTMMLLINKQIAIHQTLPQQLIPLLVLMATPASAWLISLLYSWYLVFAFRQQRPVSFTALEIWPTLNLILIPVLFFDLDFGLLIQSTVYQSQGTFLTDYLTIDDRFGASALVFSALMLIPYGFVLLSGGRQFLFLFFGALALLVPAVLRVPLLLKLGIIGVLASIVLVILLWRYFRGHAVQDAFDGKNYLPARLRGFVITFGLFAFIIMPVWFLPIYITFRVLIIIVPLLALRIFVLQQGEIRLGRLHWRLHLPGRPMSDAATSASRQWAKWLIPGAFNTDQFHSIKASSWQRITPDVGAATVTWSVLSTAAEGAVAREIRHTFAQYPALREEPPQQAQIHLLVLSNTTPHRWIAEQEARYPRSVCIITGPVEIAKLGISLQQNQFVDYRLRRPAVLAYLAQALAGDQSYVNPALPEDFSRAHGPYPLRLVGLGLRLLGALNLIVGLTALGVLRVPEAPRIADEWIACSLALGAWCFWEAERLQMRRTTLAMLLLTMSAGIGSLCYWLFSGSLRLLAPHGLFVQNGDINGHVSASMSLIFVLVAAPVAVFVIVAMVELVRNMAILQRWLPGIAWPAWRRTLGVATVRNVNLSYGVYILSVLLSATLLFTDSPYHFPRFREYDLPDAGLHAHQLTLAPNGNVWFETCGTTAVDAAEDCREYSIGYITPTGDLHVPYYSITQPEGCDRFDCVYGADFHLGPDGSLWFATSQGSFDKTVFIVRITPDGRMRRFPLPDHTFVPQVRFTFDSAGDLWYLRQTPLSLSLERDAIGRIDTSGQVTEVALPDNSHPVALVWGPDDNLWVALAGTGSVARVTPGGTVTAFTLPYSSRPTDLLVGPDHNLWFLAPNTAIIGRVTTKGDVSIVTLPTYTKPHDHLTVGTDGSVWYIDALDNLTIGRIMADGSVRAYHIGANPAPGSTLVPMPDGSIWFTLYNKIGHIARHGAVTLHDVPTLDADLGEMILGADHHLWFAESGGVIGAFALE